MAGAVNGGGGLVVVCKNAKQQIVSTELLDLFEAKARGATLISSFSMVSDYRVAMGRWLAMHGGRTTFESNEKIQEYLNDILSYPRTRFTRFGETLPETKDFKTEKLPKRCELKQLAYFSDDLNQLQINTEIWQRLDAQNKIALLLHEIVYRNERLANGAINSDYTRYLVGELFSTEWSNYLPEN